MCAELEQDAWSDPLLVGAGPCTPPKGGINNFSIEKSSSEGNVLSKKKLRSKKDTHKALSTWSGEESDMRKWKRFRSICFVPIFSFPRDFVFPFK